MPFQHYSAIMKYINQGPMMMDVHMHRPNTNSRNFMDSLLAFWPGLQVLKGDIKPAIEIHEMLYQVMQRHNFLPEVGRGRGFHIAVILNFCSILTLMLLVANLANTKCCKKIKMTETLRVLSESSPMNTNMTGYPQFFSEVFLCHFDNCILMRSHVCSYCLSEQLILSQFLIF